MSATMAYDNNLFNIFRGRLYPQLSRDIATFASEEIRLPKGPRRGMLFDPDYAPFNHFIFDAIMDDRWRKVSIVGPTQNGKTTIATNIPLLYYLFEMQEDVIFGLPSMELASGMWLEKLKPVIEDSIYRDMLPTKGAGSRGGNFTAVRFKNGVTLRFMGAGGGAEQMSSHTAKYILLTEIDKMDQSRGEGTEADPVSLIQNRCDAFEDSKIVMECTVTNEQGRIWQESMVHGSGGIIHVPCPKCNFFQELNREGLIFNNESGLVAEETAAYKCCKCEELWTNSDRLEALDTPKLVHRGQYIDNSGNVVGELPPTKNFGMHYNVLHSPMQSLSKTAGQQWEADRSDLKEVKKAMIQSKWAIPYRDEDIDRDQISMQTLRKLADGSDYRLREVPSWCDKIIFSVDIQKGYSFWQAEAYNMESMHSVVLEYGTVDQRDESDAGFYNMLQELDDIAMEGWDNKTSDLKMIDTGYRYDLIGPWMKRNKTWFGVKGIGQGQRNKLTGKKEIYKVNGIFGIRIQDDGNRIWFIEVDNTKALVHDRYLIENETIDCFRHVPQDVDITWIKSMTAEAREWDELGEEFKWKKVRRRNDYLDCASYAIAGAYFLKAKTERIDAKKKRDVVSRETKRKQPERKSTTHGNWFSSSGARLKK